MPRRRSAGCRSSPPLLRAANEAHGFDTGEELLRALDRFAPVARRYSFTARPH